MSVCVFRYYAATCVRPKDVCVCVYIYIFIGVCIYICIYIYIYIYRCVCVLVCSDTMQHCVRELNINSCVCACLHIQTPSLLDANYPGSHYVCVSYMYVCVIACVSSGTKETCGRSYMYDSFMC